MNNFSFPKACRRTMTLSLTLFLLHTTSVASFNLSNPTDSLIANIKYGASLDPEQQKIGYWNGTVYGYRPHLNPSDQVLTRLFNFEGINIRRAIAQPDGSYQSLSREVSVYRDLETGRILEIFANPFTGEPNEVFDVNNDPVNALLGQNVRSWVSFPNDTINFPAAFPLQYPNPLDPVNYTNYSAGKLYVGAELFNNFANYSELADMSINNTYYFGAWSRISAWLPWFVMGQSSGHLVYHAEMMSLKDGFDDLPKDLHDYILDKYPEYTQAPKKVERPNQTSWKVFKGIIDARRKVGEPDICLPLVPVYPPGSVSKTKKHVLNRKALDAFDETPLWLRSTGTAEALIYGSVYNYTTLFNIDTLYCGVVKKGSGDSDFILNLKAIVLFRLPYEHGVIMTSWSNVITKTLNNVEPLTVKTQVQLADLTSLRFLSYPHVNTISAELLIEKAFHSFSAFYYSSMYDLKGSWARFGPWLPWMNMTGHPGLLYFNTNYHTITGPGDLPGDMYSFLKNNYPDFFTPPSIQDVPSDALRSSSSFPTVCLSVMLICICQLF